jgi:peptide/nickel transport system permease protein
VKLTFAVTKRLIILVTSLFAASVLLFAVLNVLPGSPAQVMLGTDATPSAVAALNKQLGLDRPLVGQYLHWISGLVTGSLGHSYISGLAVSPQIMHALGITGPLIVLGLLLGLFLAVPIGVLGAMKDGRPLGSVLSAVSQVGIAIPTYVSGILLILVFSLTLGWFPASGFTGWSTSIDQSLRSLIMPAIALGIVEGAILSRFVRSSLVEVMVSDYFRTARAKGLENGRALVRHGLRNAAIPVVTVFGLEIGGLIVGAVVIENVFTLPGLGSLLLESVDNRDLLVTQDILMLLAATILVVNLLVDLSYIALDPRLRTAT